MSYDLFFYKHKTSDLTRNQIADYLNENQVAANDQSTQWFFVNEATEVYYSFETNEPSSEDIELSETFVNFDNTTFSFNINFNRPSFFGLEAFGFVEQFIADLGLYILNPQGDVDEPYVPSKGELYENWNKTNLWASEECFSEKTGYLPLEKATKAWSFNYGKKELQSKVGETCFVAKVFFFRRIEDGVVVTLSMWPNHIPVILARTDYYLLGREFKKLFRIIKDQVLLSHEAFNDYFGKYFEEYDYEDSLIIHPGKAAAVGKMFNRVTSDLSFTQSFQRIEAYAIVNTRPDK